MTSGGSAFHVTGSGVIDSGPGGILHAVVIGSPGTSVTLTLYDGTSDTGSVISTVKPSVPVSLILDAVIANGLYAEVSGTGLDATVIILHVPGLAGEGELHMRYAQTGISAISAVDGCPGHREKADRNDPHFSVDCPAHEAHLVRTKDPLWSASPASVPLNDLERKAADEGKADREKAVLQTAANTTAAIGNITQVLGALVNRLDAMQAPAAVTVPAAPAVPAVPEVAAPVPAAPEPARAGVKAPRPRRSPAKVPA